MAAKVLCPHCDSPHTRWHRDVKTPVDAPATKGAVAVFQPTVTEYRCMACGKNHTRESDSR